MPLLRAKFKGANGNASKEEARVKPWARYSELPISYLSKEFEPLPQLIWRPILLKYNIIHSLTCIR